MLTGSMPRFVQSGEQVTRLDDLQDIDELHVIEVCQIAPGAQQVVALTLRFSPALLEVLTLT